jgi:hypothetical protein
MWGEMRKKIVLISLIAVFIFRGIFCYKTWFVAFAATKYLSGRTDGKQGIVRSVIISWRNYQLHLHHWFLALIVGGVFMVKGFCVLTPEVSYGFLSAIIFQGIYCYKDWYRIIKRRGVLPTLVQQMSLVAGNDPDLQTITIEEILDDSVQLCQEPQIGFCVH